MKKAYLCAVVSLFFVAISCNNDDANPENVVIAVNPDPTEEIVLNANEVSGDIIIKNGTIVSGDAPSPNGTLPFTMDQTIQSGFQTNGFNITFDAPTDYAGAYIQVQSKDGTTADEYWDVSAGPSKSITANTRERKRLFSSKNNKLNDQEVEIDVNFENTVPAGIFCYILCIYDTDGNISEPVEVCVEVEAWGGNPNLVGTWELYKSEDTYDGMTEIQEINVEFCIDYQFFCSASQESINVENGDCETLTRADLIINADGTYTLESESNGTIVDFGATNENNCDPVFEDNNDSYFSKGNWAYDEEEGKLTLVEFEYSENDKPIEMEEFGYLTFDGSLGFEGDTFTIFSQEVFQGETESFKGYFRKK